MSQMKDPHGSNNVAAAEAQEPASLTPEQIVEQLRVLRLSIPNYGQLRTADAKAIHGAARVHADFVKASISTIGASERVQNALGRTPEDLRLETDEITRWAVVEDELRATLKGVIAANLVRRHRVGLTALQTYSISRQLARQQDGTDLLPHIAEMKRTIRFGRKRVRTSDPVLKQPAVQQQ